MRSVLNVCELNKSEKETARTCNELCWRRQLTLRKRRQISNGVNNLGRIMREIKIYFEKK